MLWRKLRTLIAQQWVGMIALFLVLCTGSAYALAGSNTVFSDDVANDNFNSPTEGQGGLVASDLRAGSVGSSEVANGSLTGTDVSDNAIAAADVTDGSLTGTDVRDNTVGGADITNDSLGSADIASGGVTSAELAPFTINEGDIGSNVIDSRHINDGTLNDEDIAQGTFVNFTGNIGIVPAQRCVDRRVTGVNAQGDHVVLTANFETTDSHLDYTAQYTTAAGQEGGRVYSCV